MFDVPKSRVDLVQDNVILVTEKVYVLNGKKPCYAGERKSRFHVLNNSQCGAVLVRVISSEGVNAFPSGVVIKRPVGSLRSGCDITLEIQNFFKAGGSVASAAAGGIAVGPSHKEGGIPGVVKSTGQTIEFEGDEVIITAPAVADDTKREFEGEQLTNREILSKINQSGGGVSFADGGEISSCKCSGKSFKFGGQIFTDYEIINLINGK